MSQYQKNKTNLDLLEQEIWVAVVSAGPYANLHLAQTDNHASTSSLFFTDQMPFLPPNQQRQSTEGTNSMIYII